MGYQAERYIKAQSPDNVFRGIVINDVERILVGLT